MKPTIKFGSLFGLTSGALTFLLYNPSIHQNKYALLLSYVYFPFLIFSIFLGVKAHTATLKLNVFTIEEAVKTGLQVLLFFAITHASLTYLFWSFVPPEYLNHLISTMQMLASKANLSPEKLAEEVENFRKTTEPFRAATTAILFDFIPGTFISIIFAFILKKP